MNSRSIVCASAGLLLGLFLSTDTAASNAAASADAGDGAFRMEVADVFRISGTGTVVFGKVQAGRVSTGDVVCVSGVDRPLEVAGIEQFNKLLSSVAAGEPAGLLFTELEKDAVAVGSLVQHCD